MPIALSQNIPGDIVGSWQMACSTAVVDHFSFLRVKKLKVEDLRRVCDYHFDSWTNKLKLLVCVIILIIKNREMPQ